MSMQVTANQTDAGIELLPSSLVGQSLRCVRNDRVLFENLDIRLNAGEILQIDGANGSGKTSLIRILSSLAQPDEGQVCWKGKDIHAFRTDYLEDLLYVGHSNAIKVDLSLLENMFFARALSVKANEQIFEDVLHRLGLLEHADLPASNLSSGQKRKLALSRLLVCDAKLWILDEPLNSLDESSKAVVTDIIRAHIKAGGSLVLTTHEEITWDDIRINRVSL
ncbi:MAG: cytochrome c biogenesis heme-transporting ATPase CcmA [Gammaproteobacteria bacterium]|nr:cytochrome c biogenesis heme-transporting ATPase CcmA [Gammaproteobacteria bacterium]